MMTFLISALFAASFSGISVLVAKRVLLKQSMKKLNHHISTIHVGTAEGHGPGKLSSMKLKDQLTFSNSSADKFKKELFLAGFRSTQQVKNFKLATQISLFIPFLLLIVFSFMGNLTPKTALVSIFLGGGAYQLIRIYIKNAIQKRQADIDQELPYIVDLMVIAVESGLSFIAALPVILAEVGVNSTLTRELNLFYQEYNGGLSIYDASERIMHRCDVASLTNVMSNIVQSERMGTSMGQTMRILADELREKHKQALREKAMRIPVLVLMPSALIFGAVLIVALAPPITQLMKAMGS
jgi:tight adherence protein C